MAHTKDDEIRAALLELRREYLAELPDLLQQLAEVVFAAKQGTQNAMRAAVSRAHALRGTAGSYRFQEISDAAGFIEDGLLGIQGGWLPAEQAWPEIERAVAGARAACVRAVAELMP
ncbi:Hpt domain-containing protein [Polyangium mundeleinium]|uniref:Hpt domain-containing protein n=1 Tax=Polyangium mundeleinium TaxID=2995306 RepID=A0ABT5EI24_9BACT|nr:Hpt domain-containing protein [Polyangium mundeleinium]MDC0741463.1 Hpt domain-containing protein [Polyangium mundeleinium]